MPTPFLGLRTCIYHVPNLAAAVEWYTKALGIKPYFNEPFYVGFNVGGYELGLQPLDDSPALPAVALAEEGALNITSSNAESKPTVETYWGVNDIQATFAHLITAGATVHEEPTNVGSDIWVAMVKDPWDNIIGIIQNPHFKAE